MKSKPVSILTASLLIFLWVYAATSKLIDHERFVFQLGRLSYLSELKDVIALALPLGEIALAFALLLTSTRKSGFFLSGATLIAFTLYLALLLLMNEDLPCSCGGIIEKLGWRGHIVFNMGCIAVAVIGYLNEKRHHSSIYNKDFMRIIRESPKPVKE